MGGKLQSRYIQHPPQYRSSEEPHQCVVHNVVHILEPPHDAHFVAMMDRFMPQYAHLRRSQR